MIIVDTLTNTYRIFRGTPEEVAADPRLEEYYRSKGVTRPSRPRQPVRMPITPLESPPGFNDNLRVRRVRSAPGFPRILLAAAGGQESMSCYQVGDVTVETRDPEPWPHIVLTQSRSFAEVTEDWYPDGGYTAISHARNFQFPTGCRTTELGTDWCRDPAAAASFTTPASVTSPIPAAAWQHQKYENTDFSCPTNDCGWLTWVRHHTSAAATKTTHFATQYNSAGGTFGSMLHFHVYYSNGGGCS